MATPARLEDCNALADVHRQSFARGWTADELTRLINADNVIAFVCNRPAGLFRKASDEPRGFVLARIAADEAEILTIAVAQDTRRLGAGKVLMQAVMNHLYAERIGALFLEVDETNTAARRLYESLNFKTVGDRKSYYSSGRDEEAGESHPSAPARALVMRCDLR
ncbi:MAG: GNAT family N-acetyltransferase [Pseudomonadota bacterium]